MWSPAHGAGDVERICSGTIDFFKSCYNFDERHINEIDFDDVMLDSCLSLETTKLICPKSLAPLQIGGQMPDWLQPFLSSGLPAGSAFRDAWTRMQESKLTRRD